MALILVVDDTPEILTATKRVLHRAGYTCLTANDGAEAIRIMAAGLVKIDLIVCDLDMPTPGFQVYEWAAQSDMKDKFLFYTSSEDKLDKGGLGEVPRVSKPSDMSTFMKAITALLPSL